MNKVRQQGFTLIEITVTVVVLATGILSLAGLMTTSGSHRDGTEADYRLHVLAVNQLERLQAQSSTASGYLALYPGGGATFAIHPEDLDGLTVSNVVGNVEVVLTNPGVERSVFLQARIDYTDGRGNPRNYRVSTFMNKDGL